MKAKTTFLFIGYVALIASGCSLGILNIRDEVHEECSILPGSGIFGDEASFGPELQKAMTLQQAAKYKEALAAYTQCISGDSANKRFAWEYNVQGLGLWSVGCMPPVENATKGTDVRFHASKHGMVENQKLLFTQVNGISCFDLDTGEVLWSIPNTNYYNVSFDKEYFIVAGPKGIKYINKITGTVEKSFSSIPESALSFRMYLAADGQSGVLVCRRYTHTDAKNQRSIVYFFKVNESTELEFKTVYDQPNGWGDKGGYHVDFFGDKIGDYAYFSETLADGPMDIKNLRCVHIASGEIMDKAESLKICSKINPSSHENRYGYANSMEGLKQCEFGNYSYKLSDRVLKKLDKSTNQVVWESDVEGELLGANQWGPILYLENEKRIVCLNAALIIKNKDAEAVATFNQAVCYRETGAFAESIAALERCRMLKPQWDHMLDYHVGYVYTLMEETVINQRGAVTFLNRFLTSDSVKTKEEKFAWDYLHKVGGLTAKRSIPNDIDQMMILTKEAKYAHRLEYLLHPATLKLYKVADLIGEKDSYRGFYADQNYLYVLTHNSCKLFSLEQMSVVNTICLKNNSYGGGIFELGAFHDGVIYYFQVPELIAYDLVKGEELWRQQVRKAYHEPSITKLGDSIVIQKRRPMFNFSEVFDLKTGHPIISENIGQVEYTSDRFNLSYAVNWDRNKLIQQDLHKKTEELKANPPYNQLYLKDFIPGRFALVNYQMCNCEGKKHPEHKKEPYSWQIGRDFCLNLHTGEIFMYPASVNINFMTNINEYADGTFLTTDGYKLLSFDSESGRLIRNLKLGIKDTKPQMRLQQIGQFNENIVLVYGGPEGQQRVVYQFKTHHLPSAWIESESLFSTDYELHYLVSGEPELLFDRNLETGLTFARGQSWHSSLVLKSELQVTGVKLAFTVLNKIDQITVRVYGLNAMNQGEEKLAEVTLPTNTGAWQHITLPTSTHRKFKLMFMNQDEVSLSEAHLINE